MLATAPQIQTSGAVPHPAPRLMDRVRETLRLHRYALSTERTYCHWIKRFIFLHDKRHPAEMGAAEVEAFLTHLATAENVSASTQNQAMHAVLYLYKNVLGTDLPWLDNVVRARESKRLPAVLTQRETAALLRHVHGTPGTIIKLLYGTGMRLLEGLRLRIKDLDLERREILIRAGKGDKDRVTVLPASLIDELRDHLAARRIMHDTDLSTGHADVELPDAIERKYPKAGAEWAWQYVFAAKSYSTDPRTGAYRRHHVVANRQKSALSACLSWLIRTGNAPGLIVNPCMQASGIRRNPEAKRDRYVTDDEYQAVYAAAPDQVRAMMELTYRTLQRPESDILYWTVANITTKDGERILRVQQGKTKKVVDIALSPDLDALIKRLVGDIPTIGKPLVCATRGKYRGKGYTYDGISAMLKRAIKKASAERVKAGAAPIPSFGFRDLKGKGATDMWLAGEPIERIQLLCGHEDKATTEIYVKQRWRETAAPNMVKMGA